MIGRKKKSPPKTKIEYPIITIEARPPRVKYKTKGFDLNLQENGGIYIERNIYDFISRPILIYPNEVSELIEGLQFILPHAKGMKNAS